MNRLNGTDAVYDVVIVGGGPGGLAAGMYAARAKLKMVVLEKGLPGGQINNTAWVEDYPGFTSIEAPELSKKMEEHARHFGAEIRTEAVQSIAKKGDLFRVETDQNAYRSRTVILATGGSPNYLGCKGEDIFQKKGVSYCAICDGPLPMFRNKAMVVVGGGDAALEEALFLTRFASRIFLVHRRQEFRAQRIIQEEVKKNTKIEPVLDSVLEEIGGTDQVEWAKAKNMKTGALRQIGCAAVFIFIGFKPNTSMVKDPLEKDALGHILSDQNMETSISGLFAVGDVRAQLTRQITNAVGDGTTAAVAAEKYIHGQLREAPVLLRR